MNREKIKAISTTTKSNSQTELGQIKLFNYSKTFGGQERYIESLIFEFNRRKLYFSFFGGPTRLTKINSICADSNTNRLTVELLNGNRALYLRSWWRTNADIRVYVQHSLVSDSQAPLLKKWIRKILLRIFLKRIDIVIRVCSQALPEAYARGKIYTVHNGVSLPPLPAKSSASRPFTLLMVGAVNDNKNQIMALRLLAKQDDLHLIVVGDGPRMLEWQQWARDTGVDARVRWTGFADAPEEYYRQADSLLLLSQFEAFPYVVLEAMAYALPVIATCAGGIPDAITHEKDGLLLPRRDLKALNDAVLRLKSDRAWCAHLGQQARKTVSERFTVEKMTDKLLALIESTAEQKKAI